MRALILLFGLWLASAAAWCWELAVIHVNDVHSRIEPVNRFNATCSAAEDAAGECFGGVARMHARIDQLRARHAAEGRPVLVLDAGDQFQGSLFYTEYRGQAAAEFMNRIGFDAMAVGNHEFDDGADTLRSFIDRLSLPLLSANVEAAAESPLAGRIAPSTLLERSGRRIGLVSVVAEDTTETSSPGPGIRFLPATETLSRAAESLRADGAEIVIALTHVGISRDLDLAARVPGIDVLVGGHSHTLLSNSQPGAAGPYPTWVERDDGTRVPVVQAGAFSRYVGELVLTFDDDGRITDARGDVHPLDASVLPELITAERVAVLGEPLQELKNRVVAYTETPISADGCRVGQCPMGTLVAEAMLARVAAQGIQVAIQNGGGLRASIDAGEITMGEVLAVLPFQNTLATFMLRGSDLLAALENGLSEVEHGGGRFPQLAGMRMTWNPASPAGSRVISAEIADGDGWTALEPDRLYGVVTNDYLRRGGDGYAVFRDRAQDVYDFGPDVVDALLDRLHNVPRP